MAVLPAVICMKRSKRTLPILPAIAREGRSTIDATVAAIWSGADRRGGLAGVVGEVSRLSLNASRRLQLCAGESGVTALIIRRWSNLTFQI